jgi:hypothetical protein
VKSSHLDTQVAQLRSALATREVEVKQIKVSLILYAVFSIGIRNCISFFLSLSPSLSPLYFSHPIPFQSELESLQQTSARTGAMMQSLRQQLAESEQKQASNSTKSDDVAQLQAEVGRMKTDLKKKVRISMTFTLWG